jgi:23S rRNA (pseudouridine1915-N3)-methyltransferase
MNIQIVAVGKLKERYWTDGIAEYMKRLGPYAKVVIAEVADEKAPDHMSEAEEEQVKHKEGERILAQIKSEAFVFVLAIEGAAWSSEQIAERIEELGVRGRSQLTFVIGGSNGVSPAVMKRADQLLSFGRVTYPHQLIRLILVEQVYRAFKIMRGEPYHK